MSELLQQQYEDTLRGNQALLAVNKKLKAALQATTTALGEHYCGVCENVGDGRDQPYHAITEAETCDGCRGNWQAWRAGKDLLDA